jgi:hypothetical protein
LLETAEEQTRSNQEGDGECDLDTDECPLERIAGGDLGAAAGGECVGEVATGSAESGK